MKLSDLKGEEALDALADMIEPIAEILTDKDFLALAKTPNIPKIKLVKTAIKNHKKAVIEILAAVERQNPETFEVDIFTLPVKLIEILNEPEVVNLFQSQGQTNDQPTSGSASENTEVAE